MLFTRIHLQHIFATVLVAVLTAVVFSFAGFLNGLYAKSFDDVSIIPTFVLGPLTYLGGIFYSVFIRFPCSHPGGKRWHNLTRYSMLSTGFVMACWDFPMSRLPLPFLCCLY